MYTYIKDSSIKEYEITTPGEHLFYFENLSADLTFVISAPYTFVRIYGLLIASDDQKYHITLSQIHTTPHSKSEAMIKSVVYDHAYVHIDGKIRIEKNAHHTETIFSNHNLLLSPKAHIISTPQLEILPHDVHCTHAAQTLPLDPEQLSYLTNRGIEKRYAEQLLIDGFVQSIRQNKK